MNHPSDEAVREALERAEPVLKAYFYNLVRSYTNTPEGQEPDLETIESRIDYRDTRAARDAWRAVQAALGGLAVLTPVQPVEGVGWRDIADAPRDGTKVLGYPVEYEGAVVALEVYWYADPIVSGWVTDLFDCGDYECEPTLWMPVPAPPVSGGA